MSPEGESYSIGRTTRLFCGAFSRFQMFYKLEAAGLIAEVPEAAREPGGVKNLLRFGDGPLLPIGVGVVSVPGSGKRGDFGDRHGFALGQAVS